MQLGNCPAQWVEQKHLGPYLVRLATAFAYYTNLRFPTARCRRRRF
jgi:hypothetical protein